MNTDTSKRQDTSLNFSKNVSALTVFCSFITVLINSVRRTLPYIAKDQDIEVLHQYRLSVRQIEALLVVFHNIVPKKILLNMKKQSKALFAATGQLRDFDLLLQKFHRANPKRKNKFPDIPLIDEITAQRKAEFEQFLLTTHNSEYSDCFVCLQACLNKVELCSDHASLKDCWPGFMKASMHHVHTAYQRLWKQKDDSHIHTLRKSLKQLRYCIELIGLIVKPRKARVVLSWLKNRQESLGDYNDIQVQSTLLKGYEGANEHIKRACVTSELSHVRQSLPLSKSDWKILRKKIKSLMR